MKRTTEAGGWWREGRLAAAVAAAALAACAAVAVVVPALGAARDCLRWGEIVARAAPLSRVGRDEAGPLWSSVGWTAVTSGAIGALACALGLAWAWGMRGRGSRWAALGIVPLLMPPYLAYAALSILRAPGSRLASRLAELPPEASVAIGKGMAVAGLAAWSWPLAWMVIRSGLSRVPRGAMEAAELDGAGRLRRCAMGLRLLGPALGIAAGLVGLVMLGSAVPLHVAQVNTYAIRLWLVMSLTEDPREVWRLALPLLAISGVAGVALARWASRRPPGDSAEESVDEPTSGVGRGARAAAWGVLAATVVGPIILFAASLHSPASLRGFWIDSGAAVGQSLLTAAMVGGVLAAIAAAAWLASSLGGGWSLRAAMAGTVVLCIAGLLPGVLVGRAVLSSWGSAWSPWWIRETTLLVLIAHIARFGFVGALAGVLLAGLEDRAARDSRRIDGGNGLRAWAAACGAARWPLLAGIGVAGACLSMHEIESTVIALPPGAESLAQQLLEHLHYARDERLAAAAVNLMAAGAIVAAGASLLLKLGWESRFSRVERRE